MGPRLQPGLRPRCACLLLIHGCAAAKGRAGKGEGQGASAHSVQRDDVPVDHCMLGAVLLPDGSIPTACCRRPCR